MTDWAKKNGRTLISYDSIRKRSMQGLGIKIIAVELVARGEFIKLSSSRN